MCGVATIGTPDSISTPDQYHVSFAKELSKNRTLLQNKHLAISRAYESFPLHHPFSRIAIVCVSLCVSFFLKKHTHMCSHLLFILFNTNKHIHTHARIPARTHARTHRFERLAISSFSSSINSHTHASAHAHIHTHKHTQKHTHLAIAIGQARSLHRTEE